MLKNGLLTIKKAYYVLANLFPSVDLHTKYLTS